MRQLFAALVLAAAPLYGVEGKWTPDQVLQLDANWLRTLGLQIPPARIWDAQRGAGLLSAVVQVGGCSAGFVSADGLFLTNHHCLFGILQEHSSPARDLIANGFLAGSRGEELRGKSTRLTVPHRFTDVTKEMLAAVPAGTGDLERHRAIEARQKELVAACEQTKGHRCRVAAFDGGVRYTLVDSLEIADVRLVYSPPRWVGEFGGEIDNFMWPRHAGDFAVGRAWVDNAPYHPPAWLPVSRAGASPGDFVMVTGYPGTTYRAFTAAEMAYRREQFEATRRWLSDVMAVLEQAGKASAEGKIAVAADLKSVSNSYKNAAGQLEGFHRIGIVEKQQGAEELVAAWARQRAEHRDAVRARDELRGMVEERRRTAARDSLLQSIASGPKTLSMSVTLVRAAIERQKPDRSREPAYMERLRPQLRDRLERSQKNYFEPADKELFALLLRRAGALPPGQRLKALDRPFPAGADPAPAIAKLYGVTRVVDLAERLKMFEETPEQLRARHDPALELAFALHPQIEAQRTSADQLTGALSRLRPPWRRAVMAHAGKPLAPDANSTLRVSFASVQGYEPREGVVYKPQTTLAGMLEKYTGEEPFDAPAAVLAAARTRDFGPWADARLKNVVIDFLADGDTTGGSSGSPVLNARGELVGLNFDSAWESIAKDFGFDPATARNISVDVRYLLWMLDRVSHADTLLRELLPAR